MLIIFLQGLMLLPPWPRHFNGICEDPNECTLPLTIEVSNLMFSRLDFDVKVRSLFCYIQNNTDFIPFFVMCL